MARRALSVSGKLTEAAWQEQVVGAARVYGWRTFHAPDGGHAPTRAGGRRVASGQIPEGRGFPDLVLVRAPRIVVAELKAENGRMGPGQAEWLEAFAGVGSAIAGAVAAALSVSDLGDAPSLEAFVWRPADWPEVQAVLGRDQTRRHDLDPPSDVPPWERVA
jgi:hypothetical protein